MKLAAVGLGIKPVILFKEGVISLSAIARGRKKSLLELARQAAAFLKKNAERLDGYSLQVGYGLSREDGEEVLNAFRTALRIPDKAGVPADAGAIRLRLPSVTFTGKEKTRSLRR